MRNKEEVIRQQIIRLNEKFGIKYSFIANKVGMDRSTICHFVKHDRKTANILLGRLEQYLKELKETFNE